MLGAVFMATDYVTTPITAKGKIIFGIGCGIITCVIRFWCSFPEGVSFSNPTYEYSYTLYRYVYPQKANRRTDC